MGDKLHGSLKQLSRVGGSASERRYRLPQGFTEFVSGWLRWVLCGGL